MGGNVSSVGEFKGATEDAEDGFDYLAAQLVLAEDSDETGYGSFDHLAPLKQVGLNAHHSLFKSREGVFFLGKRGAYVLSIESYIR